MKIRHHGRIENGRIIHYNEELYQQQLQALEGKEFVLVIEERHRKPSPSQQGFYRGGILPSCHNSELFFHFDKPEDIHTDFFAPKFLGYTTVVQLPHEKYEQKHVKSLADVTDKEMTAFIDRVLAFCAENDIVILEPDNYLNKKYGI